jgi:hypothetical protein
MIRAYVANKEEVLARFDVMGDRLRAALRTSIAKLTIKLQNNVKTDYLSGQALNRKTGDLQRSIAQVLQDKGEVVSGIVSTALVYGIGWELGWPGGAERALAAGKAKFDPKGNADTFANGTPKKRPFLVPALRDLEQSGAIKAGIEAAVAEATKA